MRKKVHVVVVVLMVLVMNTFAQSEGNGQVQLNQDPRVDSLVEMHITHNQKQIENPNHDGVEGFRIQIFFDSGNNSKSKATEVIEEFTEDHPETGAYLIFREPYYRVRVGDFRTKIEALGFLQNIQRKYPNAWVIKDKINFPVNDTN